MAIPIGDSSEPLVVDVDVDDVTIVLGLLAFLVDERPGDDPLVGVATRVAERLRTDLQRATDRTRRLPIVP